MQFPLTVAIEADVLSLNGFPMPGIFDSISVPGELMESNRGTYDGQEKTQITGFKPRTITLTVKWVNYDDAVAGIATINAFFMAAPGGILPKYFLTHPYAIALKMGLVNFHKFTPSLRAGSPLNYATLTFREAVSPLLLSSAATGATGAAGATDTATETANETADSAAEAAEANNSNTSGVAKSFIQGATDYNVLTGGAP